MKNEFYSAWKQTPTELRLKVDDKFDVYDLWESYDAEQQKWMDYLPESADCGHPIQT
jgi:hypothetical protein